MRKLFVCVAVMLALACNTAPANAEVGWVVVFGYGYPRDIVAGPYDSRSECLSIASAMGYSYHCDALYY